MSKDQVGAIRDQGREKAIEAILALAEKAEKCDQIIHLTDLTMPSAAVPTYEGENRRGRKKKPGHGQQPLEVARNTPTAITGHEKCQAPRQAVGGQNKCIMTIGLGHEPETQNSLILIFQVARHRRQKSVEHFVEIAVGVIRNNDRTSVKRPKTGMFLKTRNVPTDPWRLGCYPIIGGSIYRQLPMVKAYSKRTWDDLR